MWKRNGKKIKRRKALENSLYNKVDIQGGNIKYVLTNLESKFLPIKMSIG